MPTSSSTLRIQPTLSSNALEGAIEWAPAKSFFVSLMIAGAALAPFTYTHGALALFIASLLVTVCAGHSVGMHRLHVHRSFKVPKWLERMLVYLGTLVGMAGPIGIIKIHDVRDWAQQQPECHDYFAHRSSFWVDAWWQLHGTFKLKHPPQLNIESDIEDDWFYQFIERTWMLQQVPWALLFFYLGGLPWVVWGIALRVAVSLSGHWLVVHFAHQKGHQGWSVDGVAVQGYNLSNLSLLTFGESWHGNHHAFPGSARLGIEHGQPDPGWWLIKSLEWLGLAREIKTPAEVGEREGLRRADPSTRRYSKKTQLFAAWVTSILVGVCTLFVAMINLEDPVRAAIGGMVLVVPIATLAFVFAVVPAIRRKLNNAGTDMSHALSFYLKTGLLLTGTVSLAFSALAGPGFVFLFALLFVLTLPAGISASFVFGILNRRAIRKELAHIALTTR
jgi:sn-1 stearoyl-lipid 9-desaturase